MNTNNTIFESTDAQTIGINFCDKDLIIIINDEVSPSLQEFLASARVVLENFLSPELINPLLIQSFFDCFFVDMPADGGIIPIELVTEFIDESKEQQSGARFTRVA